MFDPTRSKVPKDSPGSSEHERPVAQGFGEFSDAYRTRWALSHPDMQRRWPADTDSELQLRGLPEVMNADERPEAQTSSGETP